jgi:hypothetical protein
MLVEAAPDEATFSIRTKAAALNAARFIAVPEAPAIVADR